MSPHKKLWVRLATAEPEIMPKRIPWCPGCILKRSMYIPGFALLLLFAGTTYLSTFHRERLSFLPGNVPTNCSYSPGDLIKDSISKTTFRPFFRKLRTSFKSRRLKNSTHINRKGSENLINDIGRGSSPLWNPEIINDDDQSIKPRYGQPMSSEQIYSSVNVSPEVPSPSSIQSVSSEELSDNYVASNIVPKTYFKKFDKWTEAKNLSVNFGNAQGARLSFLEKTAIWKRSLPYRSEDVDIMALKRFPFLDSYKNPCWIEYSRADYSKNYFTSRNDVSHELAVMQALLDKRRRLGDFHRVRCMPYFLIIGQPKCGSTDLYRKIIAHPDVCNIPRALKEPHWWARARLGRQSARGHVVSMRSYVDLFDYAAYRIETESDEGGGGEHFHNKITGEGSMSTFWDNDHWWAMVGNENTSEPRVLNPDYVHHVLPDAKLILILRNPTQRMYSDFLYFRKDRKMPIDFHESVVNAIRQYNACMRVASVRSCAYNVTINLRAKIRLRVGMYAVFLEDWLRVFPREQLFIVRTEDYAQDPQAILRRLYSFLGLRILTADEEVSILSMRKANTRREQDVEIGDMLPETRALLDAFYKPYNTQLARMLGNTSFLWKDTWS